MTIEVLIFSRLGGFFTLAYSFDRILDWTQIVGSQAGLGIFARARWGAEF